MHPEYSSNPGAPSHIVGIGASAGGLKALEQFFTHMPPESGMAFVVIQHLSPDFRSLMDDLLGRCTKMPIYRVSDGMTVSANSIYLIPPRMNMTIREGRLYLTERATTEYLSLPIDIFLHSLAKDAGERAVGIVLSGTGSDGSRGIRSIAGVGGLVLAQSLDTAQFDGMPRSALATDAVRTAVAPEAMPEILIAHVQDPESVAPLIAERETIGLLGGDIDAIFTLLRRRYRIDFAQYKATTVGRRIQRRMDLVGIGNILEYVNLLAEDSEELDQLYFDLLIGVTAFFRDTEAFEALRQHAILPLLDQMSPDDDIRVWVAGCATGEEAYSVAMMLIDEAEQRDHRGKIHIFATDVHPTSLVVAGNGLYEQSRLTGVPERYMQRYFSETDPGMYKVATSIRKHVIFSRHDVVTDPPFTRLDLICCRNLLIYLQPHVQDQVIGLFHFALKVGGVMFLGSSEGLGRLANEMEPLDKHWKIFRKRRELKLNVPLNSAAAGRTLDPALPSMVTPRTRSATIDRQLLQAYDALLEQYMPPGFLIDENRRILHYFGDVSTFLQPRGRADEDVLSILKPNLSLALGTTLERVRRERSPVVTRNVRVPGPEGEKIFDVLVRSLRAGDTEHFHIAITETTAAAAPAAEKEGDVIFFDMAREVSERTAEIELELKLTRESLQATVEELQTSNEELQATNEELLAANEELQSTNEELHSVNEELFTVNVELESKNQELQTLNQDLDHLLRALAIGIVYLDRHLRIRKFNPAIAAFFELLPQDIGRPLEHIAYRLEGRDQIITEAQAATREGLSSEREVRGADGRWFLRRITPQRSDDQDIEGCVVSFAEVTAIKEAQEKVRISEQRYRGAVAGSQDTFVLLETVRDTHDHIIDFRYIDINDEGLRYLGRSREAVLNQLLCDVEPQARHDPRLLNTFRQVVSSGQPIVRVLSDTDPDNGRERHIRQQIVKAGDGVVITASDISEQKAAEHALINAVNEKELLLKEVHHRVKNNLQVIASIINMHTQFDLDLPVGEMLEAMAARIRSIALLHNQIYQADSLSDLLFEPYARALIATLVRTLGHPDMRIQIEIAADPIVLTIDQGLGIGLLLNEFVTNSFKHAFIGRNEGTIWISMRLLDENWGMLIVADDGIGSSKYQQEQRRGVGSEIVDTMVAHLHGSIERNSDTGYRVRVRIPNIRMFPVASQPEAMAAGGV